GRGVGGGGGGPARGGSRAFTSSRRRSRSIAPFPRAASARGWCLHSSLRSCLRPVGSCRCRTRAGTRCRDERAFRSFAQARQVESVARATQSIAALASPVTAATLHVRPRAAMAAASAGPRGTVRPGVLAGLAPVGSLMRLGVLPAGDEGRQPVDIAFGGRVALRLARLMGLALLVLRERLRVARDIGLRLAGAVRRIGGAAHRRLPIVV